MSKVKQFLQTLLQLFSSLRFFDTFALIVMKMYTIIFWYPRFKTISAPSTYDHPVDKLLGI